MDPQLVPSIILGEHVKRMLSHIKLIYGGPTFSLMPENNLQVTPTRGNEKIRYAVTAGFFQQEGVDIELVFKRFSARINLDAELIRAKKRIQSYCFQYRKVKLMLTQKLRRTRDIIDDNQVITEAGF